MGRYAQNATEQVKRRRAYAAYQDLMHTAAWMGEMMSRQLATFGLTMTEFRVLETLYREGPQYQRAISQTFRCSKQTIAQVIRGLEEEGWVSREASTANAAASSNGRGDRRVVLLRLTPEGKDLIANVLPNHVKVVKAEMRALDGRQQQTLSLLCRKLRAGDPVRTFRELITEEVTTD